MGASSVTRCMSTNCTGCSTCSSQVMGLGQTTSALLSLNGIKPWVAADLVMEALRKQAELARRTPLRKVSVQEGLAHFDSSAGWSKNFSRDDFVLQACTLLELKDVRYVPIDVDDLFAIFDSMDFDGCAELSIGEWAGGLSVFLSGSRVECIHKVLQLLDPGSSRSLSKRSLEAYLLPFVKAMTPVEAAALRPVLLQKTCDDILEELSLADRQELTSQEMVRWIETSASVIERLNALIENEVRHLCHEQERARHGVAPSPRLHARNVSVAFMDQLPDTHQDSIWGGGCWRRGHKPSKQCGGGTPRLKLEAGARGPALNLGAGPVLSRLP
eukprot:gnl/TRDRNA2_/TRDRNA2_196651_c0_seq1.p1 gnl/TRDRNA2_/TRDRNA2_196651_c0~~gnl/TRDRNA2_/TRDRNA2_196651_c0_seq1.p1  ORF type:complete len:329 (+),score=47.90 gnl/TRDRNA2_/TRDRNA2_196651_c0_seq1:70-1056(+)